MSIAIILIGVLVIFGLLSLLASTLMDWISRIFGLKERNLDRALKNMLASTDVHETVYNQFRENPLYRQLAKYPNSKRSRPSSMPKETFQSVLMNTITQGNQVYDVKVLKEYIEQLPDIDLKNTLRQLMTDAGDDPMQFKANVENWYAGVIRHSDKWYEQATKRGLLSIGLAMAVFFNIDAIHVFKVLQNNPEYLEKVFAVAQHYPSNAVVPAGPEVPADQQGGGIQPMEAPVQPFDPGGQEGAGFQPFDPGAPAAGQAAPGGFTPDYRLLEKTDPKAFFEMKKSFSENLRNTETPMGIGWKGDETSKMTLKDWGLKFLGWLITAVSISFGAPVIFDILKRVRGKRS